MKVLLLIVSTARCESYPVSVRIRDEMTARDHFRLRAYLGGGGPETMGMKPHVFLVHGRVDKSKVMLEIELA